METDKDPDMAGNSVSAALEWTAPGEDRVTVTVPDAETLLASLSERIDAGEGFAVATLNLDHAVKLKRDPAFAAAYAAHTHITADGNPVVWLSRIAGQRDVRLVPGSELIEPVAALAAEKGVPLGLFGATEASLTAAGDALEVAHPGLRVPLRLAPPMGFDPDGPEALAAIDAIGQSGVRVVFLALGAPKQERFAARAFAALPHVGFLSIGAGLDFVSGAQTRAPKAVRGMAGEWLWRLAGSPRRLGPRYAACLAALAGLTGRALATRRRAARGA